MVKLLNVIYSSRYNVVHLIAGVVAVIGFILVLYNPQLVYDAETRDHVEVNRFVGPILLCLVGILHITAIVTDNHLVGRAGLTLSTFLWMFITVVLLLNGLYVTGVVVYAALSVICFLTALDMSFNSKLKGGK